MAFTKCLFLALLVAVLANQANGFCYGSDFECDSGDECVPDSYRCNGEEDCYDGSDEDGCLDVGLAVGLTVFFFILFCVCAPIVICVLIYCCVAGALGASFRGRPVTTTIGTTAAPTATVVTSSQQAQVKTDYPPPYSQPMQQYPPQGYPPQQAAYPQQPAYPPQQPAYPVDQAGYPVQQPVDQTGYPAAPYPPQ